MPFHTGWPSLIPVQWLQDPVVVESPAFDAVCRFRGCWRLDATSPCGWKIIICAGLRKVGLRGCWWQSATSPCRWKIIICAGFRKVGWTWRLDATSPCWWKSIISAGLSKFGRTWWHDPSSACLWVPFPQSWRFVRFSRSVILAGTSTTPFDRSRLARSHHSGYRCWGECSRGVPFIALAVIPPRRRYSRGRLPF